MKVVVTGGCGFLGSHLCEEYINRGWEVVAFDNLTKFEFSRIPYLNIDKVRNYNLDFLKGIGVEVVVGDVRNIKEVEEAIEGANYVIHTAAQPAMTLSLEEPSLDFGVNCLGALNVLLACREYNVPVVNCSTIHIYGTGINGEIEESKDYFSRYNIFDSQEIGEDHKILTGDLTPLHASKRTAEIYFRTFTESYGLKAATFRLTGMYGPRQFGGEDHGWVANFAIRTVKELPIKVFGTDKQVRDIIFVKDAVEAFTNWFDFGSPSGVYNIGGGEIRNTSLKKCLLYLEALTGKKQEVEILPARKGDLWYFSCDSSKARKDFNWVPLYTTQGGLEEMLNWIYSEKEIFSL